MRRSTRAGLAVILTSVFLPLIALMFTESIGGSLVIRTGSISRRATFEQFPIGRDPHQELGVVLVPVAGDTLVLDRELPKDEADRITREFSRFRAGPQTKGEVYVFDVSSDGTLTNHRLFTDCMIDGVKCGPDGLRCDVDGNVWMSSNAGRALGYSGVIVRNPAGRLLGLIRLREVCANITFGGPRRNRLFMAASQSIYALYVATQGAAPA
jgi:hypothetical protein